MKITKTNLQESLEKINAASFFFSLEKVKQSSERPIKLKVINLNPRLAETHWSPLGEMCVPFQDIRRKLIPGIRFFECFDCGISYEEKTRDCFSPSVESCPNCFADNAPFKNEQHPEWPLDKSGNLI